MTVDEIEKEARKWILNNWEKYDFIECDDSEMDDMFNRAVMDDIVLACVAVAVPREKRIAELEKENISLKSMIEQSHKVGNNEFWKSVWACKKGYAELKEQIEKMKCCENCKYHRFIGDCLECKIIDCNNYEKWEIKEND